MTRLGHRGAVLALIGAVWMLYGASRFGDPPEAADRLVYALVPVGVWAGAWIATGALAAAYALARPGGDRVGFAALVAMPAVRAAVYLWAWLLALTPGPPAGDRDGYTGALIWAAVIAVVLIVADWPDDTRTTGPLAADG